MLLAMEFDVVGEADGYFGQVLDKIYVFCSRLFYIAFWQNTFFLIKDYGKHGNQEYRYSRKQQNIHDK